jgi:hypothetical protein
VAELVLTSAAGFPLEGLVEALNSRLAGVRVLAVSEAPLGGPALRQRLVAAVWELEVAVQPRALELALDAWREASTVEVVLRRDAKGRMGALRGEDLVVDAKTLVHALWAAQEGPRLLVRACSSGVLTPFQVVAALLSWPVTDLLRRPACRLALLGDLGSWGPSSQGPQDLLRATCGGCGGVLPLKLDGEPYGTAQGPLSESLLCGPCADVLVRAWGALRLREEIAGARSGSGFGIAVE